MTLDLLIVFSAGPLFILTILNYAFCAYVATHKLEEMESHFEHSIFVSRYHSNSYRSIIRRVGCLGTVWAVLVFKHLRNLDPGSIEGVNHFPKHLRAWVIIPGHINAFCTIWLVAIGAWSRFIL
ncbi:hypothetical protein [Pseudomonas helvetica]|uniref:hypothetical protein n=1 Tax=Pseudomonas helvetica TaxID=3136738 RepID=UPI0032667EA3